MRAWSVKEELCFVFCPVTVHTCGGEGPGALRAGRQPGVGGVPPRPLSPFPPPPLRRTSRSAHAQPGVPGRGGAGPGTCAAGAVPVRGEAGPGLQRVTAPPGPTLAGAREGAGPRRAPACRSQSVPAGPRRPRAARSALSGEPSSAGRGLPPPLPCGGEAAAAAGGGDSSALPPPWDCGWPGCAATPCSCGRWGGGCGLALPGTWGALYPGLCTPTWWAATGSPPRAPGRATRYGPWGSPLPCPFPFPLPPHGRDNRGSPGLRASWGGPGPGSARLGQTKRGDGRGLPARKLGSAWSAGEAGGGRPGCRSVPATAGLGGRPGVPRAVPRQAGVRLPPGAETSALLLVPLCSGGNGAWARSAGGAAWVALWARGWLVNAGVSGGK